MGREAYIVFFTVLVDVIGFGIVIPILPFYATEFGVSPTVVTLLFASFSFCSFLSAPFLGALSDRIGRRPVIILSIISTAIGWFVFASATAVWMLFLGRIIDGAAAGNFTSAQGYMVDIARDEKERTRNLGILSAIFGVGFLLGPILGGLLSKVSHVFPFWIAGILASLNAVSAILFLPESHHTRSTEKMINVHPLSPLIRAWHDKPLRPLYVTWTTFAMAFVIGQSVFALFVKDVFGFSAFAAGMAFSLVGVVVVINQVFLLQRFWLKRFDESRLQVIMLMILVVALACIGVEILPLFYVGLIGLGTGQAVLRVVVTSQVAGSAGPLRRGESIGILTSIMSASMAFSPILAGMLYEIDHVMPFILAIVVLLSGLWELRSSSKRVKPIRVRTP
jgi:DHA1 family tetracycline resistance protein-like MFS transporter